MSKLYAAFLAVLFAVLAVRWHAKARDEASRADAAVLQSSVDTGTAAIADRVASDRVVIIQQTEDKASAVEAIPSDDIPADILSGWSGLRYSGERSDPERAGELPAAVPGAEP